MTNLISIYSSLQESNLIRGQVLFFLFAFQGVEDPSDSLHKEVNIAKVVKLCIYSIQSGMLHYRRCSVPWSA